MKRLLVALLAGAHALFAPSAQATPPDVITIEDQPFAAAPDKVFVLRTTSDNLGLHTSAYSETFLVAIDVATGAESYWLVYRARRDMISDADPAAERVEVTLFDREDWHDPYAIVADAGAALVPVAVRGEAEEIASPANGEIYSIAGSPSPTFAFSRADALAQMDRSLAMLAELVDDIERMAPISTRDLYRGRLIDRNGCSFVKLGWPIGMGASAYQLIRIDCDDGEGMESASLIQAILPD